MGYIFSLNSIYFRNVHTCIGLCSILKHSDRFVDRKTSLDLYQFLSTTFLLRVNSSLIIQNLVKDKQSNYMYCITNQNSKAGTVLLIWSVSAGTRLWLFYQWYSRFCYPQKPLPNVQEPGWLRQSLCNHGRCLKC